MRTDVRDVRDHARHVFDAVALDHAQFVVVEEYQLHWEPLSYGLLDIPV